MLHHIDARPGSDYCSGSAYTRVLNMPGYTRFLKKCCIIDAWQDPKHSSGSEHSTLLNMPRVTQGSEQNASL